MSTDGPPDPTAPRGRAQGEFETLWQAMRLGDGVQRLPTDATIRSLDHEAGDPRALGDAATLHEVRPPRAGSLGATPAPAAPDARQGGEHGAAVTLPTLPRIALARLPTEDGAAPAPVARGTADLEVRGVLGEGGMGQVLLAHQRSLRREVAIKVVKPEAESAQTVEALLTEALVTGHLEHPGVIPVHALGRDADDRPLLVMKRVEGASWRAMLRDPEHPAWARLDGGTDDRLGANLQILMQVCNAVHFAHTRGYVHRDIKPDNVMVGGFGEVYLVDWGIAVRPARAPSGASSLVGTPAYMAPEMVGGGAPIDARTDVYLLGATLHEALTGEARHAGETLFVVLARAFESAPYAYGGAVPEELGAICNRATHARADERFESALALRQALAEFLRHRGSIALAALAHARLAELRALHAAPAPTPTPTATEATTAVPAEATAAAHRRFHQLATECRFGFAQALREWRENAAARDGLQGCLEIMVEHEIRQGNAAGAEALLDELPIARPALAAQLAVLREALRERASRDERLARLDREADPQVAWQQRAALLGIVALMAAVLSVYAIGRTGAGAGAISARDLLVLGSVMLAVSSLAAAAFRKALMRTAVNRRALGLIMIWLVSMVVHRAAALHLGVVPSTTIAIDLLLGAVASSFGALGLDRRMWSVAAVFLPAFVLCVLLPALSVVLFTAAGMAAIVLLTVGFRSQLK